MENLDAFLRQVEESPPIPPTLIESILRRIGEERERGRMRAVIASGWLLCCSLILFFLATASAVTRSFETHLPELWNVIADDPGILFLSESWYALLETMPFLSIAIALCAFFLVCFMLRRVLLHILPTLPLRHHAF